MFVHSRLGRIASAGCELGGERDEFREHERVKDRARQKEAGDLET